MDKQLTIKEVDILVSLVKTYSEIYGDYPVYGIDAHSVSMHKSELFRLSIELDVEVESEVVTVTHGKYDCNHFYYEGVRFQSQDTLENYE